MDPWMLLLALEHDDLAHHFVCWLIKPRGNILHLTWCICQLRSRMFCLFGCKQREYMLTNYHDSLWSCHVLSKPETRDRIMLVSPRSFDWKSQLLCGLVLGAVASLCTWYNMHVNSGCRLIIGTSWCHRPFIINSINCTSNPQTTSSSTGELILIGILFLLSL